jgi:GT2 family glycosyltransferase
MATVPGVAVIPALIVPILNRPELLHRMLDSIDHPVADLVIIDNGNVFPAWEPVEHVERTHVIKMPSNLGVAGSWNLGIKALPFAPYWLIVNSDAWFPAGSLAMFDEAADRSGIVLSGGLPPWCAFALGDHVVEQAGLFDEGFHPCYFEDTDYERRTEAAGLRVHRTRIPVHHDNSSTLNDGHAEDNNATYPANEAYYLGKRSRGDYGPGAWDLTRRRDLSWD